MLHNNSSVIIVNKKSWERKYIGKFKYNTTSLIVNLILYDLGKNGTSKSYIMEYEPLLEHVFTLIMRGVQLSWTHSNSLDTSFQQFQMPAILSTNSNGQQNTGL